MLYFIASIFSFSFASEPANDKITSYRAIYDVLRGEPQIKVGHVIDFLYYTDGDMLLENGSSQYQFDSMFTSKVFLFKKKKKMRSYGAFDVDGYQAIDYVSDFGADQLREIKLADNQHDPLSLFLQMRYTMMTDNKKSYALLLNDGRKLEDQGFHVVRQEWVDSVVGDIYTVVVKQVLSQGDRYLWLSPDFDYLPIKIKLIKDKSTVSTMVLSKYQVMA